MMFTVSAWLRTEDTRGRVDLWLLAYSDEAGTQNVDEIPLSRYNIVDERRVAVPMEPDADWHHYSARTLRLPPIARSFRIALRHRGLDSGGTNQTYMDDVQVRRVWEYEATLDPDFERIRHHAESESDWFAGNTDWSVYWGGGPVWPEHFETSRASPAVWEAGQLELEGTAAVVSRMIPYGGDAIRVELSYSMDRVAHSGEERTLAYLVGFAEDEYATHIPLLRDNGSSGARNRVLSIGDATHQIPEAQCVDHLQIWLVNSPSTSGTVTFDRVSLTLQRDEPAGGDYLIDRSQADVTVDLSSRGVPFQPPAMGFNASYARSIVGVYRQAGFESAAAPAQSPDPDIRPVRAFDYVRFMGLYQAADDDGEALLEGDFSSIDARIELALDNGLLPLLDVGSPPRILDSPDSIFEGDVAWWNDNPLGDPDAFYELSYQLATHLLERYGDQVADWRFVVHNEPNAFGYFEGSLDDYLLMFDNALAAFQAAGRGWGDGEFRFQFGGPAWAGGPSFDSFLDHCARGVSYATGEQACAGLTFLDWHLYTGKRSPDFGAIESKLAQLEWLLERHGFTGSNRPDVMLSEFGVGSAIGLNAPDDPRDFGNRSAAAAFLVRGALLLNRSGIDQIVVHSMQEQQTDDPPDGFGDRVDFLARNGLVTIGRLHKPSLVGLHILAQLPDDVLSMQALSSNEPVSVEAFLDPRDDSVFLLLTNYEDQFTESWNHTDWASSSPTYLEYDTTVNITFSGPSGHYAISRLQVDSSRHNTYTEFLANLDAPAAPPMSGLQLNWEHLPLIWSTADGELNLNLPNHSVSLIRFRPTVASVPADPLDSPEADAGYDDAEPARVVEMGQDTGDPVSDTGPRFADQDVSGQDSGYHTEVHFDAITSEELFPEVEEDGGSPSEADLPMGPQACGCAATGQGRPGRRFAVALFLLAAAGFRRTRQR